MEFCQSEKVGTLVCKLKGEYVQVVGTQGVSMFREWVPRRVEHPGMGTRLVSTWGWVLGCEMFRSGYSGGVSTHPLDMGPARYGC